MNTYIHDPSTDLESNIVQPSDRVDYPDSEPSPQLQPESPSQTPITDFRNNLNYSIKFNTIKLLISWGKAIASIVVLRNIGSCIDRKGIWVMMMLMHDSLYCIIILMTIYLVVTVNQMVNGNNASQNPSSPNRNNNSEQEYVYHPQPSEPGVINIAREITRKQKLIGRLSTLVETFYFGLFIYGQVLLFLNNPTICESQDVNNIMLAYIIMGYAWMMSPLIFIILACLCLPVMMFIVYVVGRGGQVSANRSVINNLVVKRFGPDLPGSHDCAICMLDYKDTDKLIQLRCSPMHHFHEDCIKRWLTINGQCPICRTRVTESE